MLGAARMAGVQALDGPFLDVADEAGLRASARAARELGFDGKWAIHPRQVDVIASVLRPTAAERAEAQAIEDALANSAGVAVLDGKMIDEAHRRQARRILAVESRRARRRRAQPTQSVPPGRRRSPPRTRTSSRSGRCSTPRG